LHVIALSSEHNYTEGSEQRLWLETDLAAVDRTPGTGTPFVLVMLHRALYDTTLTGLLPEEYALREELEGVFEAGGVSLVLQAHIHNYQRTCGNLLDGNCTGAGLGAGGSRSRQGGRDRVAGWHSVGIGEKDAKELARETLRDRKRAAVESGHAGVGSDAAGHRLESALDRSPGARFGGAGSASGGGASGRPYVVIGSGGKSSGARFWVTDPSWLAYRTEEYGYLDVVVHNETAASARYVSDADGSILDEFEFGP